jgi:hypothetical protein
MVAQSDNASSFSAAADGNGIDGLGLLIYRPTGEG